MADESQVRIPTPLRGHTDGASSVERQARRWARCCTISRGATEAAGAHLFDEKGGCSRFVNIFVNGEDIRFLQHLDTPVKAGDELSIVPAIAGGSWARSRRCGSTEAKPLPGIS